jgi:hypothetical protein
MVDLGGYQEGACFGAPRGVCLLLIIRAAQARALPGEFCGSPYIAGPSCAERAAETEPKPHNPSPGQFGVLSIEQFAPAKKR